jgi:hypothetical protein
MSSAYKNSSMYSEEYKDDYSVGSKQKSNGGYSNKQNEHKLKEKRSIFRAFKSFYGKGLYLDPESA